MSKKAAIAIFIALLIPVVSYLVVKQVSEDAIVMPRRFLMDSVITKTVDGKTTTDTAWHKTADISLTNQLGEAVNLYDVKNKIVVMDFFFTRCPNICPVMTQNMAKLQQSFSHFTKGRNVIDSSIVQFVSFTIDPERDSVGALRRYADKYHVNHDNWWMLTGEKKKIYDFALNEVKLGLVDGEGVDTSFIHSQKFVLLDKDYVVRGYYNGLDTTSLAAMAKDIGVLMLERDKKKKMNIFQAQ
jgi:protein SCO1/2